MTKQEIELSTNFMKKVEELKPTSQQILSDYERDLKDKRRGWKTQVSQNVGGLSI